MIYLIIKRLNLKVVVLQIPKTTTSNALQGVEEPLQKLHDALALLKVTVLDQAETLQLCSIIQGNRKVVSLEKRRFCKK
jgi:hypothetical protein